MGQAPFAYFCLPIRDSQPDCEAGRGMRRIQVIAGCLAVVWGVCCDARSDPEALMLAAVQAAGAAKFDKIANDCIFARTYDVDTDEPVMVATGQYAHNYEAIQKLKSTKVKVVRDPRYGVLIPYTTHIRDGKVVPSDMHFGIKSTDQNYIGPDLAEYAVELNNGKRVLVRTLIYWVNRETDSLSKCPPSKFEMQEMREIQKRNNVSGSG